MRSALLLLAPVLMSASPVASGFGTKLDDDWPPARFQQVGSATVLFARDQDEIEANCGKVNVPGKQMEACANGERIVLPNPCGSEYRSETYAKIACHEAAHRFGNWPADHPQ